MDWRRVWTLTLLCVAQVRGWDLDAEQSNRPLDSTVLGMVKQNVVEVNDSPPTARNLNPANDLHRQEGEEERKCIYTSAYFVLNKQGSISYHGYQLPPLTKSFTIAVVPSIGNVSVYYGNGFLPTKDNHSLQLKVGFTYTFGFPRSGSYYLAVHSPQVWTSMEPRFMDLSRDKLEYGLEVHAVLSAAQPACNPSANAPIPVNDDHYGSMENPMVLPITFGSKGLPLPPIAYSEPEVLAYFFRFNVPENVARVTISSNLTFEEDKGQFLRSLFLRRDAPASRALFDVEQTWETTWEASPQLKLNYVLEWPSPATWYMATYDGDGRSRTFCSLHISADVCNVDRVGPSCQYPSVRLPMHACTAPTASVCEEGILEHQVVVGEDLWQMVTFEISSKAAGSAVLVTLRPPTLAKGIRHSVETYPTSDQHEISNSSIAIYDDRAEIVFPNPKVGTWWFAIKGPQNETMIMDVKSGCPHDCGAGRCSVALNTFAGVPVAHCICPKYYTGQQCEIQMWDDSKIAYATTLIIVSNLAMVPAIVKATMVGLYSQAVIFFFNMLASAFYHACDQDVECFGVDYGVWQFWDFMGSFLSVAIIILLMAQVESKKAQSFLETTLTLGVAVICRWDIATLGTIAIFAVALGLFGIVWSHRFWRLKERRNFPSLGVFCACCVKYFRHSFNWWYLLGGGLSWAVALSGWFVENNETYWYLHSMWHLGAMMSAFFFMSATLTTSNEQDRMDMIDSKLGLGMDYVALPSSIDDSEASRATPTVLESQSPYSGNVNTTI